MLHLCQDERVARILLTILVLGCGGGSESTRAFPSEPTSSSPVAERPEPASEPTVDPPQPPAPAEPDPIERLMALDGSTTLSIGGPNDGRLEGAVALPERGPGFESNMNRPNAQAYFGTVETIQALVHAAGVVAQDLPGSNTRINDIGFETGGAIAHHASHRAGRDADVLFYMVDGDGNPTRAVGAFLDRSGMGVDFQDLAVREDDIEVHLDAPRTWLYVQALLSGPHRDLVQRIFVAEHVRTMLLRAATAASAPTEVVERFEQVTCQPGYPHDDHLHIRFYCTPEDMAGGCEDSGPTYPWRREQLAEHGLRPVINRPRRDRPRSRSVTDAEARAQAGEMDARVTEWLERREAWRRAPHPGRPFCR